MPGYGMGYGMKKKSTTKKTPKIKKLTPTGKPSLKYLRQQAKKKK